MRDVRDVKAMAQTLRDAFTAKGVSLTHSESLELIARTLGFHDWNELAARIQSERKLTDTEPLSCPAVGLRAGKSRWMPQYSMAISVSINTQTTLS
jgi:uncharacterized protein